MGKDFLSNINSIKMPGEYPISKYRKVIKKADPAQESEIRVRVNSPPFAYAAYAGKLLLQKDFDYVYLNATGAAVSNSIKVIEYLKTHIKGLHISYNILSKEFVDEDEPKDEGLDKVTTTRTVSTLEAKLTIKKGEELAKEVGYMAPSANEDDIDQKGFEDSMAKYNERKATKQDGGDRRGGDRRGGDRRGRGGRGDRRGGNRDGYKRGGDRRPRTQSGKYNDNEERKEGGNGGERRTNNYDNREGGDRRRYNNDNRDGGDRRRNDNRDGGDRRNDNRDVKRYDNRDNRDNRNRDNYNKDNNRDEKRYDNRDNRDNRNRDNYTKTDSYQKDDRRTDDRRDGGDNRRDGGDNRRGGDRNYDNRRSDGDNRRGGDRREDNRQDNYQKDYKNDRD